MKKFILTCFILLWAGGAFAQPVPAKPWYLCSDLPAPTDNIVASEVEYKKNNQAVVIVPGIAELSPDGADFRLLDITKFGPGKYTFRARWSDAEGWWSVWSDPYEAGKSGKPGALRTVED